MTTFERRRTILRILTEDGSVRVTDLAQRLDVSEGTIRNDLAAMDEEQQLLRVRGGAALREEAAAQRWTHGPPLTDNASAKQLIARWASELIENGDTVLFDASTTVQSMASYLHDRRNLTVVTNGLDVARALAENPSNTVILLGGILGHDGLSVSGSLAEKYLRELHIQRAFVTCAGFSLESGLTEFDIHQVQLKSQMIRSAQQVIALVDSSKFDKIGLTPFAAVSDITHLFTDSDASPEMVAQLQHRVPNLTICAAETTSSFSQQRGIDRSHYRIGFANLSETLPFAIDVRRGLERAVKEAGNIDLIVSDNQLNASTAIHIADELLRKGVDLMIEYQIDESIGGMLMNRFQQAHVPVIAVDIPLVGATFFGADNYQAGLLAGAGLGEWINAHWDGECQSLVVLEEPRAGSLPAARMQGQIDGLINSLSRREIPTIFRLDSSNNSDVSADEMYALLQRLPQTERIAVLCFNDEAALGALSAADEAGRTQHVAIVGQGADWRAREAIRRPGSRIIGSTGLMPEQYGARLIDTALKILRGEPVAPAIYTPCVFITADNIGQYYPLA